MECLVLLTWRPDVSLSSRTGQRSHRSLKQSNSFYVDGFLGGAKSLEEAIQLVNDLRQELLKYGFPLRKWSSNDQNLQSISNELRAEKDNLNLFADDYKVKALGISWKPNQDVFIFKCSLDPVKKLTKRNLLSETSKLFDPLGWLAPLIIQFKILMQQTWVRGLS